MLANWFKAHPIHETLIPVGDYHPYPKLGERAAWDAYPSVIRAAVIDKAERRLDMTWPSSPATEFMEYFRSGSREEPGRIERREALLCFALAECFEAKGRFIDQIINGIWMICEESFWGVSAHNGVFHGVDMAGTGILPDIENPFIDLFAAETAAMLACIRYLLKDAIDAVTPLVTRRIDIEMERRIVQPFLNRIDFWWMGFMPRDMCNWTPWICSNMLTVFLLMEQNGNRRAQAVEKICRSLDLFLASYGADGGCDEGTSYWFHAGGSLFDCLEQLSMATGGALNLYGDSLIKNIGAYISNCHIAGDYFVNFADGGAVIGRFNSPLVYRYGKRVGDGSMMGLASSKLRAYKIEDEQSLPRLLSALEVYDEIAAYDKGAAGAAEAAGAAGAAEAAGAAGAAEAAGVTGMAAGIPPMDVWMGDIQVAIARSASSYDGIFLAAKGGHNDESHNHNDVGSFILFADGFPCIIDLGVETYTRKTFSPERYSIWTMRSTYHNLPVLNGFEQLPGAGFRAADVQYFSENDHMSLSMDIGGAYDKRSGIKSYRRTYMLDRSVSGGGGGCLTLTDEYEFTFADYEHESMHANELLMNFMSVYEPILREGALQLTLPNGKILSIVCEAIECETKDCVVKEFEVKDHEAKEFEVKDREAKDCEAKDRETKDCETKNIECVVEHIEVDDPRLISAWGTNGIYRASFKLYTGQRGKTIITFVLSEK